MPDVGTILCPFPGALGCAAKVATDPGGTAKDVAKTATGSFVGDLAAAFANAFGKVVEMANTFWVHVPTPQLDAHSGAVGALRTDLAWVTGAVAVLGILIAAVKMMLTRKSQPATQLALGLGRMLFASFVLLPATVLLTSFGDDFSTWVIGQSTGGHFGAAMLGIGTGLAAIDPILLLIVVGIAILASLAQILFMFLRIGVMILMSGVIPTLAASSMTESGDAAYKKAVGWLLAYTLFKPAAALIYAGAFLAVGQGDGVMEAMSGIALMILVPVALPALLRLIHPAAAAVTGLSDGAAQRHAGTALMGASVAKGAAGAMTGAGVAVMGATAAGKWAVSSVSRKSSPAGSN
jgi:type IV secretion system protein TrbL